MSPSLTVAPVAKRAGCSEHHIRALARRGEIPHFRIGAAIRFDPDEIDAWFESRHVAVEDTGPKVVA